MTLLETIAADQDDIFLDSDSCPQYRSVVYTPKDGVAQDAIDALFHNVPLHGDPHQEYPVVQHETYLIAKSSDVSSWKENGTVEIDSTDYRLATNPYPSSTSAYWSVINLSLPLGQEDKI